MLDAVRGVNCASVGAIHPMFKPEDGKGKVIDINSHNTRQLVVTSNGMLLTIPVMLGSTTKVEALADGTYKVTSKGSYYGAEPKTTIMTEEELIEKFGKFGKPAKDAKFCTVA